LTLNGLGYGHRGRRRRDILIGAVAADEH
jgi:hypothetical protein